VRSPEDIDSAFYYNFLLRPLSEVAALIERAPGRILLKPISETGGRSLAELAEEYRSYRLHFVWIYRNPVNVSIPCAARDGSPLTRSINPPTFVAAQTQ